MFLFRIALFALIFVSLLITMVRLSFHQLSNARELIESNLSKQFNVELSVGSIEGDWEYFDPIVRITDLTVVMPNPVKLKSISLGNAEIRLNGLSTLLNQTLVFSRVFVNGWGVSARIELSSNDAPKFDLKQVAFMLSAVESLDVRGGQMTLAVDGRSYKFMDTALLRTETSARQQVQFTTRPEQGYLSARKSELPVVDRPSDNFRFILDLENSDEFTGQGYVELPVTNFDSKYIPWLKEQMDVNPIKAGSIAGRAWLDIEAAKIRSIKSNISFENLELQLDSSPSVRVTDLGLNLHWHVRRGNSFSGANPKETENEPNRLSVLGVSGIEFNIGDTQWDMSSWILNIEKTEDKYSIRADGGFTPIDPFTPLAQEILGADHLLSIALQKMNISGALRSPRVEITLDADHPVKYEIWSALDDVAMDAWNGAPSIGQLNGYVALASTANGTTGILTIDSEPFELHFPKLFGNKWQYKKATGAITWSMEPWGVLIRSDLLTLESELANANGIFHIQLPYGEQEPELSLLVGVHDTSLNAKADYLSNRPETQTLMDWLDTNLISGLIEEGAVLYQGTLKTEANPNSRNLQLVFDLLDVGLTYDPQWPGLEKLNGTVWVNDDKLQIESSAVKTRDIVLGNVVVTGKAVSDEYLLDVSTEFQAQAEHALDYIRKTPIADLNPELIKQLTISGELSTKLALHIPIKTDSVDVEYEVELHTHNNDLELPDYFLKFEQVAGTVNFSSETGITSNTFSAIFLEEPVTGSVESVFVDGKPSTTSIELKGATKLDKLTAWYDLSQFPLMSGKAEYRATLDTYYDNSSAPLLQVYSDLTGVTSTYPAPLRKEADQNRPFRFSMELSGAPQHLNVGLDDNINLSFEVSPDNPVRGQLVLGEGVASQLRFEPIKHTGFSVKGTLKEFDLEPWVNLMAKSDVSNNSESSGPKNSGDTDFPIDTVDLNIANLKYGDLMLGQSKIDLSKSDESILLRYQCNLSSGQAHWYFDSTRPFLVEIFDLQLNYEEPSTEGSGGHKEKYSLENIDPRNLPAVDLSVDHLALNGRDTGAWKWKLRSDSNGAHLSDGAITSEDLAIENFRFDWLLSDEKPSTEIQLNGRFRDISQVMKAFGVAPVLSSEKGVIGLSLTSSGRPDQISALSTSGAISINSKNGHFLAGDATAPFDVLDLFNFEGFVGGLGSDFAGLVGKSMKYRRISGEVLFENGTVRIKDIIKVEGISANFELSGLYYVEKNQLDMSLVVTLPVSGNLPWYGALVGGLPAAAAVFLASKLFENSLKVFSSARYRITGKPENPIVKLDRVFETETNSKIMELYEKSGKVIQGGGDSDEQQQPAQ